MLVLAEIQSFKGTWRHVIGGKLREITEEAKSFAVGNKTLVGLFVHTPVDEHMRANDKLVCLQRFFKIYPYRLW